MRKIDVEPDFESWKSYALGAGVHPSILSFLEIEQECFYSVESTPTGKRFVSARGWTDLSRTITTLEEMGKTVDIGLIGQFVQESSIAERFAVYYELFSKYRSDYQVGAILKGSWQDDVVERAQRAAFDERLAVLNLILDAVETQASQALEREAVIVEVRDALRQAKPRIVDGEPASAVIDELVGELAGELETRMSSGTVPAEEVRLRKLAIEQLRSLQHESAGAGGGMPAFSTISDAYTRLVDGMRQFAADTSTQLENAFSFIAQTFGNEREMLVFVADLSTRPTTMRFVNAFGSDGYAAYSERLAVQERRNDLLDRANELAL